MNRFIYSVRDELSGFLPPALYDNEELAKRDFKYMCVNNEQIKMSPSDYTLYFLGEFDTDLGTLTQLELPRHVIRASSILKGDE